MTLRLAAVIPALEAASTVGDVVRGTRMLLPEVVVVDDGSTDATAEAARDAGARVLRHAENRGKGAALRTAFQDLLARGFDAVVTLDADGQHLPAEIPVLVRTLEEQPSSRMVLGVRDAQFGKMSALRRAANRISSRLISIAAGTRLSDVQTGFRLYHREILERVPMEERGFDLESAVVVRAARRGIRIASVPVKLGHVDGRATSHFRPLRDGLLIARAVVRAGLGH